MVKKETPLVSNEALMSILERVPVKATMDDIRAVLMELVHRSKLVIRTQRDIDPTVKKFTMDTKDKSKLAGLMDMRKGIHLRIQVLIHMEEFERAMLVLRNFCGGNSVNPRRLLSDKFSHLLDLFREHGTIKWALVTRIFYELELEDEILQKLNGKELGGRLVNGSRTVLRALITGKQVGNDASICTMELQRQRETHQDRPHPRKVGQSGCDHDTFENLRLQAALKTQERIEKRLRERGERFVEKD